MKKENLIAFDFDGTLYPIKFHDSEQLLILASVHDKGCLKRMIAKRVVQKDMQGKMIHGEFNRRFSQYMKYVTPNMIQEVATAVAKKVAPSQFDPLRTLSDYADLAIISCGTENLIHAFLEQLNLSNLFIFIQGKELLFETKVAPSIHMHVESPLKKQTILAELKKDYTRCIALGDGPTDLFMLSEADLGLIIDWTGKSSHYPYKQFPDLASACQHCLSYLQSAPEAFAIHTLTDQ